MHHDSSNVRRIAALLLLAGHLHIGAAQPAPTQILTGPDLNERNVIKALFPEADKRIIGRPPSASLLITFETNSTALSEKARQELDVVAGALANSQLRRFNFVVEGHADPRGTSGANLTLSQLRANAVRAYLMQRAVEPGRLVALGKGDREPLKPQEPAAPENRRVTFTTQPLAQ